MLTVLITHAYKRSFKKIKKSGTFYPEKLRTVIKHLVSGESLPEKYRDHKLTGNFDNLRECHVTPDLLLVYQVKEKELILVLVDIGSHSELFG